MKIPAIQTKIRNGMRNCRSIGLLELQVKVRFSGVAEQEYAMLYGKCQTTSIFMVRAS
jgi:hypothetical protein